MQENGIVFVQDHQTTRGEAQLDYICGNRQFNYMTSRIDGGLSDHIMITSSFCPTIATKR